MAMKTLKQWNWANKRSAIAGLKFQKQVNPKTFNAIKNSRVLVGGQAVAVKSLLKKPMKKRMAKPKSKGFVNDFFGV